MIRVAILTTDSREHYHDYRAATPYFGAAPQALLAGMASLADLELHVVSCLQQPAVSPEKLARNIWYHGLFVPKIGWLRTGYQGCIRAVRTRLHRIRPDIVHGQGTERDCALSAVFSGHPNVVTIHGNMAELARLFQSPLGSFQWWTARLENFALKRTAGVFCNSEYTERLVRPRAVRTWRVPNPIRPEFFRPIRRVAKPERCRLLNVGVISPRKRQCELLDLALELHRRGVQAVWEFVGHADPGHPYAAEFLRRVKEAEAQGYARYLGLLSTPELLDCFDRMSGVVHFPNEEAFGLVVAEALARNLRFFGSRLGGIQEIAANVEGAELFEAEDWTGLKESIRRWAETGGPQPTQAALTIKARYHPAVIAHRHREIYLEVLKRDA